MNVGRIAAAASISMLFAAAAWAGISSTGLVAYYPFNGDALDASGNGWNALVYGATPTADRFGSPDSAYHFDGDDDYIDTLIPNTFTALTMSVWANFKSYQKGRSVIIGAGWWFTDNYIGINNWTDDYKIEDWSGGCGWNCLHEITAPFIFNLNQWYHLAYVHNGTNLTLYINGVPLVTTNAPMGRDSSPATARKIRIGTSSCVPPGDGVCGENVNADLDDAAIYGRALSSAEISALWEDRPDCDKPPVVVTNIVSAYCVATIGFSTDPDGDQDVTEFLKDETCYVRVKDVDLYGPSARKDRLFVEFAQKNRREKIELTRGSDGSYTASVPLSSFKLGPVSVTVATQGGEAKLRRKGTIRIH